MPFAPRQHQVDPARPPERFFLKLIVAIEEPSDRTDPRLLLALIEQTALDLLQC
jgi:hypothetical protein